MRLQAALSKLKESNIQTWSELGQFLDKLRDEKVIPTAVFDGSFEGFKDHISNGIGFITFHYGVYGVTVEMSKYASAIKRIAPNTQLHFLAGEIPPDASTLFDKDSHQHEIKEMRGFGDWSLYNDFYHQKLTEGSEAYKELFHKFWKETLVIFEKLGSYIEENNIQLLYTLNICSHPGNVSLTLATVLISEYLNLPVLSNNHEFYWEGGSRPKKNKAKKGSRDHFFTNAHISDFFSLIERLFPWESRSWFNINVNRNQSKYLIEKNGHNPANVAEIGTAIDTRKFTVKTKRNAINAQLQVETAFKRYGRRLSLYSPEQVLRGKVFKVADPQPILIGASKNLKPNLSNNNIVLLQPTRILLRKRVEVSFWLLQLMFQHPDFIPKFENNPQLKITILVTGALPLAHADYFEHIVYEFDNFLRSQPSTFRNRIFLGFLFSEIDKPRFRQQFEKPIDISDLYNMASLVMLPSENESRGLPIIEATACGVPIFCRRYDPAKAYAEVIGEHLSEKDRLKVIEYDGGDISPALVKSVIDHIFFPQNYIAEVEHNYKVIQNRYSIHALRKNLEDLLYKYYLQLCDNSGAMETAVRLMGNYIDQREAKPPVLQEIMDTRHRKYIAGYHRLSFTGMLESITENSHFRKEAQLVRGMAMRFALKVMKETPVKEELSVEQYHRFFNVVDSLFHHFNGNIPILHDHSFCFKRQNLKQYPYRKLTYQELTGLISVIFHDMTEPMPAQRFEKTPHFFVDWRLSISQLTNSSKLAIDERDILFKKIQANIPIAYFPGGYVRYELEVFVLQSIRQRLGLEVEEELTEEILEKHASTLEPIYIFCVNRPIRRWLTADTFEKYLANNEDGEMRRLVKYNICQVIKTEQWTVGVHFGQLGEDALQKLSYVRSKKGFIIANGEHAALMTDIIDIDRFHIGKAIKATSARMMGIERYSGFVQFTPAGVRTTIGYPTPIQTAKDFYEIRKNRLYKELCRKIGASRVLAALRADAAEKGTPFEMILEGLKGEHLKRKKKSKSAIETTYRLGLYDNDKMPYSMVMTQIETTNWEFKVLAANEELESLSDLIDDYDAEELHKVRFAANGGYYLLSSTSEKLQLPEQYHFQPLGMVLSAGKIVAPPQHNRMALVVYEGETIALKRVNVSQGMVLQNEGDRLVFSANAYNNPTAKMPYFDAMYEGNEIPTHGNTMVLLAGNQIAVMIPTKNEQQFPIQKGLGLVLSIPPADLPASWKETNVVLEMQCNGFEGVLAALEGGPTLIEEGKSVLDLEGEAWQNDLIHLSDDIRTPKIAVGLDKNNEFVALCINGRVRESVGATYTELIDRLLEYGVVTAMALNHENCSLMGEGKWLNIPPQTESLENNDEVFRLQAPMVKNLLVGWKVK